LKIPIAVFSLFLVAINLFLLPKETKIGIYGIIGVMEFWNNGMKGVKKCPWALLNIPFFHHSKNNLFEGGGVCIRRF